MESEINMDIKKEQDIEKLRKTALAWQDHGFYHLRTGLHFPIR